MSNDAKQGWLAGSSGNTLEVTVIGTMQSKGFQLVPYREFKKICDRYGEQEVIKRYGTEIILKNVPFISIYKHPAKTEFLLLSKKYNLKIRIECKWQQSSGSVDEKFPYLYLNCIEAMPEDHIIIIVDGGGAKVGGVEWLKNASREKLFTNESNCKKTIEVMNIAEFVIWANKTFR